MMKFFKFQTKIRDEIWEMTPYREKYFFQWLKFIYTVQFFFKDFY